MRMYWVNIIREHGMEVIVRGGERGGGGQL